MTLHTPATLAKITPQMTETELHSQLLDFTIVQLKEFGGLVWQFVPRTKAVKKATLIDALLTLHRTTVYDVSPRIVIDDYAELTDAVAEAATWKTSRGCEKCGADCRTLSAINSTGDHFYTRCESCGDVQRYDKPVAAPAAPVALDDDRCDGDGPIFCTGDAVCVKHTTTTGVISGRYWQKYAVILDGSGRVVEFYPSELARLTVPTPSAPPVAPVPPDAPHGDGHRYDLDTAKRLADDRAQRDGIPFAVHEMRHTRSPQRFEIHEAFCYVRYSARRPYVAQPPVTR